MKAARGTGQDIFCARSTARTNEIQVPQDHKKRQTSAARHGKGDRTTPQDSAPASNESVGRCVFKFQQWSSSCWTYWVSRSVTDTRSIDNEHCLYRDHTRAFYSKFDVTLRWTLNRYRQTNQGTRTSAGHLPTQPTEQTLHWTWQPRKHIWKSIHGGAAFPIPSKDSHLEPCPKLLQSQLDKTKRSKTVKDPFSKFESMSSQT